MFLKVTKVRSGQRVYEYLRILEGFRDAKGDPTSRVVANLGRVDRLEGKLDSLVESLAKFSSKRLVAPSEVKAKDALPWGPILLARHLYDQLGLGQVVRQCCSSSRRQFDVAETAFVLVANRLTQPRSEHGLARWLENYYVCDAAGERWQPEWLPEAAITKEQRVRVKARQLNVWYRTLDALLLAQREIETALYLKVRDLFSLEVDMVLYDVTSSTYFERRSPAGKLRRHGKSRDGKPRNVQVLLGVVMANGFPIAHHVFPGNAADKATLETMVTDLEGRLGLRRVLLVGDRGFVSEANLAFLTAAGRELRYLLGIPGRRHEESAKVLSQLRDEAWQPVDAGNRVQAVELNDAPGVRYFVVDSEDRRAYESELRQRSMERAKAELEKVVAAVATGRLQAPTKISARATQALAHNHGSRYYSYEIPGPGQFRYHEDPDKLAAEILREGRYLLKTNDLSLSGPQVVTLYKQLSDVEWAYRDLKDVLQMRPIYHRKDERIEGHLFIATLALFLKRTLEHRLTQRKVNLTASEALAAMHSVGLSVLDFDGQTRHLVSHGGSDARRVIKALGIDQLAPPGAE